MIEQIRYHLARSEKKRINDPSRKIGAVILPIFTRADEYYILLIKRAQTVKEHKGQISFPGGGYKPRDKTILNTALREFTEETGIPSDLVQILGDLDDCTTTTSNYIISPFVGFINSPFRIKIDRNEVEKAIEIPVNALLDENSESDEIHFPEYGKPVYLYENEIIWGATAKILNQFLNIWTQILQK